VPVFALGQTRYLCCYVPCFEALRYLCFKLPLALVLTCAHAGCVGKLLTCAESCCGGESSTCGGTAFFCKRQTCVHEPAVWENMRLLFA